MSIAHAHWTELKEFIATRGCTIQWFEMAGWYHLWAIDGPFSIEARIRIESTPSVDQVDFETNYKSAGNSVFKNHAYEGDRLKVTMLGGSGSGSGPQAWSSKFTYVDMNAGTGGVARDTILDDTAFVNVFSYSGSGLISGFSLSLEDNAKWVVKFTIDGNDVFGSTGMSMLDLVGSSIYGLKRASGDVSSEGLNMNIKTSPLFWSGPLGKPIVYSSSVVLSVKRILGESDKKFKAGLIALTKET